MSENNRAIARKFLRLVKIGDPNMADGILVTDCYRHAASDPNAGIEGVKAIANMVNIGVPSAHGD